MTKERKIFAGDYVKVLNPYNEGGKAGPIGADYFDVNPIRIVRDVFVYADEIQIKLRGDEESEYSFQYSFSRHHVEPVLTASGKNKRARAPRGKPWNVKPYPEVAGAKKAGPAPKRVLSDDDKRIEAKATFLKAVKERSGVSQWLSLTEGEWRQSVAAICHASIGGYGAITEHYEGIAGVYEKIYDEDQRAIYRRWFDYLVHRSPWKDAYITKDFDKALTDHVQMNVELAAPIVMGAITILRQAHEFPQHRKLFAYMLEQGFTEDVAIASLQMMNLSGTRLVCGGLNTGHTVFSSEHKWQDILKFMRNGYSVKVKSRSPFCVKRRFDNSFKINQSIADLSGWKIVKDPWGEEKKDGFTVYQAVNLDLFREDIKEFV